MFSRRKLLASLGLALPAAAVLAAEADAATVAHKKRKTVAKHTPVTQVSHKRRKPAAHPAAPAQG
jgi:hypothetical protein